MQGLAKPVMPLHAANDELRKFSFKKIQVFEAEYSTENLPN